MCGRFTLQTPAQRIADLFIDNLGDLEIPEYAFRYNIAPTQDVACVRSVDSEFQFKPLRWGLVPFWAKDLKMGAKMINARGETVSSKPAFRSAFKKKRCLVISDGFYEWKKEGGEKQPYHITLADGAPFCMAGLWERWKNPETDEKVETCTIITTEANEFMSSLHDRMPVILDESEFEMWLDPTFEAKEPLEKMLDAIPSESMKAVAVSKTVNKVANDSAECLNPANVQQGLF